MNFCLGAYEVNQCFDLNFYLSQKKIAEEIINLENKKLSGIVVTKLSMLKNYCPAEEYHQKYLEKK